MTLDAEMARLEALLGADRVIREQYAALSKRIATENSTLPPAASGRWALRVTSQPFPDMKSAERAEALFKDQSERHLESLGREFFWGKLDRAESLCWSLPGMARFREK